MFSECEDVQTKLKAILSEKHKIQFKHILCDLKINPNAPQQCFNNLSIFEKVLTTPRSSEFIDMCIRSGSDFFKKNDVNEFPLHYAISSMCPENVKSLFASASNYLNSDHKKILFSNIVNVKLARGNNYLHNLMCEMNDKNAENVLKIVKVLVINECSLNTPNDQLETPFYLLLKKMRMTPNGSDFVEFVLRSQEVDFFSNKSDEIFRLMEEINLENNIDRNRNVEIDSKYMFQLLEHRNERKFIEDFERFRIQMQSTSHLQDALAKFLKMSAAMNLCEVIKILIENGAEVNSSVNGSFPPAFTACTFGHSSALEIFLTEKTLTLRSDVIERNLLHQICMAEIIHRLDRQRCFSQIISDLRCSMDIINGLDRDGKSPLYYACKNGLHDIVKSLLKRGAFIGHPLVVANMKKEILEPILDSCITPSADLADNECEVHLDCRFLMPPKSDKDVKCEVESLRNIAESEDLNELLLHPIISSFLQLKWKRINWLAIFNVFVYLCFMLFLGYFILTYFDSNEFKNSIKKEELNKQPRQCNRADHLEYLRSRFLPSVTSVEIEEVKVEYKQKKRLLRPRVFKVLAGIKKRSPLCRNRICAVTTIETIIIPLPEEDLIPFRICVVGSFLIALYELSQFLLSPRKYLFRFSNWLDLLLIWLSFNVLVVNPYCMGVNTFKTYKALTFLIMSAQTVQSIAKVSIFSMSIHLAIFKKVFATFLKTISLYMLPILAFAMTFYTLKDDHSPEELDEEETESTDNDEIDDEIEPFSDIFMSIITTIRMMLADFDKFTVKKDNDFQNSIFLLFIILVTIVLFNLLNALAISDTGKIMKEAKLVEIKKRVSLLHAYEKLFKFFGFTFANLFPQLKTFVLRPHVSREIMVTKPDQKKVKKAGKVMTMLLKLVMLFNPLEQTSAYFSVFNAKKRKMCQENRLKHSGYIMTKSDFDKIVNFVKAKSYQ